MEELEKDIDGLGGYLRFDERTDVLASLNVCLICLRNIGEESSLWKWAVMSLHNALQGAIVCHLSGTAQIGALTDKSIEAISDWFERDHRGEIKKIQVGFDNDLGTPIIRYASKEDEPPEEQLADAETLFKRLYNTNKRRESGVGRVLALTDSHKDSFRRLKKLRNNFSHFTPKGWSIELAGLPNIFLNMIEVIETIANDDWSFRNMKDTEKEQLRHLLKQLEAEVGQIMETNAKGI